MSRTFQEDFRWQQRFIPQIKQIIGMYSVEIASFKQDTKYATDFLIAETKVFKYACRIRTEPYLKNFNCDFTIRFDRPSGQRTEFEKILSDGFPERMIYAVGADNGDILAYKIVSLNIFRIALKPLWDKNPEVFIKEQAKLYVNSDKTRFLAFRWDNKALSRFGKSHFIVDDNSCISFLPRNTQSSSRFILDAPKNFQQFATQ